MWRGGRWVGEWGGGGGDELCGGEVGGLGVRGEWGGGGGDELCGGEGSCS